MANNEGLCGNCTNNENLEGYPNPDCEICKCTGYTPAEPADALEDAARAYLVEHGWKKESNWFAYQAVVNRMHEFARQEIQRREQEIAEELQTYYDHDLSIMEFIEKLRGDVSK